MNLYDDNGRYAWDDSDCDGDGVRPAREQRVGRGDDVDFVG